MVDSKGLEVEQQTWCDLHGIHVASTWLLLSSSHWNRKCLFLKLMVVVASLTFDVDKETGQGVKLSIISALSHHDDDSDDIDHCHFE